MCPETWDAAGMLLVGWLTRDCVVLDRKAKEDERILDLEGMAYFEVWRKTAIPEMRRTIVVAGDWFEFVRVYSPVDGKLLKDRPSENTG